MGTGNIANDMVTVLKAMPGVDVAAVGSRSQEGADRFGGKWDIATRHSTYEALASDETLDIVYVATPSLRHVDDSIMCLEAGKAVLCEKSMASNLADTERVLGLAKEKQLLFMHGVWSRFFPAMGKLREVIDSGKIGTVVSAHASFCQNDGAGSCSATLETGIYCAQFLQWAFGGKAPEKIMGVNYQLHENGNDEHVSALLKFPCGGQGTFECSLRNPSPRVATIMGTLGVITVNFPFWCPTKFTVQGMTGLGSQTWSEPEVYEFPLPDIPGSYSFVNSEGLSYEAEEMNRCLRAGLIESPSFDSTECAGVMSTIAEIRSHWEK